MTWDTTVLLNDTGPACEEVAKADYWLAITSPYRAIPAYSHHTTAKEASPAVSSPPNGSSCQVMVTFTKLAQVPETAALVINQAGMSSAIILTVSRDVTLAYYLGIPAGVGIIMTVLLFFLSLFVKAYGWDGKPLRCFCRNWWERPIFGSGAWTVNDSWATNISTGLVVVTAVLSATAAANSLFPGVALDRFAIVNIIAGAIVVAAPVVFGIYYAWFAACNPGLTADATVKLPKAGAVSIEVPSGASITMSGDATVRDADNQAMVRAGCTYQVPPGTKIDVQMGAQAIAQAVAQAVVDKVEKTVARAVVETVVQAGERAVTRARAMPEVQAVEQTFGSTGAETVSLAVEQAVRRAMNRAGVKVVAQAVAGAFCRAVVQAPASARAVTGVRVQAVVGAVVQASTDAVERAIDQQVEWVVAAAAAQVGTQAIVQRVVEMVERVVTDAVAQQVAKHVAPEAAQAGVQAGVRAGVRAVAQALCRAAEDAVAHADKEAVAQAVLQAGVQGAAEAVVQAVYRAGVQGNEQVDIQAIVQRAVETVAQAAEAVAFPSTADIGVRPGSILEIRAPGGTWTIQASDQLAPPPRQPSPPPPPPPPSPSPWWWAPPPPTTPADVHITYPARIDALGGAKITVVGTADVTFPMAAVIAGPQRQEYKLPRERKLLTPQGANVLVANMGMLMTANIFTMFGIGAELGIAFVLAYFSEATQPWRGIMFGAIAAVALLVIIYARTAISAIANPQPGSSISAQAGTSFTL